MNFGYFLYDLKNFCGKMNTIFIYKPIISTIFIFFKSGIF